jgi:RNA polymerase sigma factor (sigma-70 family)
MHINHQIARGLANERSETLRRDAATSRRRLRTRGTKASGHASSDQSLVELVRAASRGDDLAWDRLVATFSPMVSSVIRRYRLNEADEADVAQLTWLRLYECVGRVNDPTRVGAWLATTARRECLRVLRAHGREVLSGDDTPECESPDPQPWESMLTTERDQALWRSFARLEVRDQTLLGLLVRSARPDYHVVSGALDMPVGSIGPTRQRALARLREHLARAGDLSLMQA